MPNLILNTDSYKASHYLQYPPGTQAINSYISSRGCDHPELQQAEIVHFGLQAFLKDYLDDNPITYASIDEAEQLLTAHGLPFNRAGWEHIIEKHQGRLPLMIEALPEGSVVPIGTPQVQVRNYDVTVPWLTSYMETAILRAVWYPSTVATVSREAKKIIYKFLKETSDQPDLQIPFKLHDFGARGVSSQESATLGGLAHLVNFMGTDTLAGILGAQDFYYAQNMPAFSIPAAEHSTITAWGEGNERAAYSNMLDQFGKPNALVAVVSDSYDIYHACSQIWGEELKDRIISSGATLVIRPDSGNPPDVVLKCTEILAEKFGFDVNLKGYKTLYPQIRLIQGDGINLSSIRVILNVLKDNGWSADNIAFGMGGGLLQQVNRDTFKYAMKASAIFINGNWKDIYKKPVTDPGKNSHKGIIVDPRLQLVYNGELLKSWSFDQVRQNAKL